jgi:hypothetical protein
VTRLLVPALALLLAGCPKPPAAPVLDGTWPSAAGRYDAVLASWTRGGEIRNYFELSAKIHATILSPQWRAAVVDQRARVGKLSDEGRANVAAEQHAADDAAWEVEIILSTWDRRENDLDRGEKSIWRVALIDADGHDVLPTEIVRDRRPDEIIHADFPAYDDFSRAYIARFPKTAHVLGEGVAQVGLRMSSPRGGVELTWK